MAATAETEGHFPAAQQRAMKQQVIHQNIPRRMELQVQGDPLREEGTPP